MGTRAFWHFLPAQSQTPWPGCAFYIYKCLFGPGFVPKSLHFPTRATALAKSDNASTTRSPREVQKLLHIPAFRSQVHRFHSPDPHDPVIAKKRLFHSLELSQAGFVGGMRAVHQELNIILS